MEQPTHTDQLQAPLATSSFVMPDGTEYAPGEDGLIAVQSQEHVPTLRALGCTVPGCEEAQISAVAETPAEDIQALVNENATLQQQVRALTDQNRALEGDLTSARQVEDELRDRIQQLEAAATAREGTTERSEAPQTHEGSSDAPEASGDTSPGQESPIKTVDGVTVEAAEAFDDLEYNFLKEWAAAHGVHLPSNVKKTVAIQACKDRFAELTAPKE